jgi:hypothetical protein
MQKIGNLGSWAFLVGMILAVVFAFVAMAPVIGALLIIIGLIIGLLNVTEKEVQPFLMAGTVLVVVSALGSQVLVGAIFNQLPFLGRLLTNLLVLFVPATIIVALKSVFTIAKKK